MTGNTPAAITLKFNSPVESIIEPQAATVYEISSDVGGKLAVNLETPGFAARLSLIDASGDPLVESDSSPTKLGDCQVNIDVPAGADFIEVQSAATGGAYQISAQLDPALAPFQSVPSQFIGGATIAVIDVTVDGKTTPALITPDGVRLGVGDGTFQSSVTGGPLVSSSFFVSGITVGDFQQDQQADFAVLETAMDGSTANVLVFENRGGSQFQVVETIAVEPDSTAIDAIDVSAGTIDLAVTNYISGEVTLLAGDGQGGFSPASSVYVGSGPVAVVSGEFGDGHVDVFVADQGNPSDGTGPSLARLQDDGPGQFQLASTIPLAAIPSALAAGDFGNGQMDLAIADVDTSDVTVIPGIGNGQFAFQSESSYSVGTGPGVIVACSLRNNGVLDLIVANQGSNDISVLLGAGNDQFQPEARYAVGENTATIAAADLNGDGYPDLLVATLGNDEDGDVNVLIGRGNGTFQDGVANPVGNGPTGAVTADLNHDGNLDIITADLNSNDVSVLMGNGDGSFQPPQFYDAGMGPTDVTLGDFNGDGRLDLAVADGGIDGVGQGVSILLGNGNGTFSSPQFYDAGTYPASLVAGDFTGNGILDLAVANLYSSDVSLLFGNGEGGFGLPVSIPLGDQGSEPDAITMGDFGNGHLDLAVADRNEDGIWILKGNGRGGFQVLPMIALATELQSLPVAIIVGDFRGNDLPDLAILNQGLYGPDSVSILQAQGDCSFRVLEPISLGTGLSPTSLAAGNLSGDANLDLAIADSGSNEVTLLEGDGRDGFMPLTTIEVPSGGAPYVITSGDFTSDGRSDLAIVQDDPNSVTIELNEGNGQFVAPGSVALVPLNTPVVADFTGDGVPDVAIVDGAGNILFRRGIANEPGTFAPPITINPVVPSRDIADVTTSHGMVLASVDATDTAVSLFAYRNGAFARTGTLLTGLEPAQIVSGNLGGGGDDDLVVRNAGDGTLSIYLSNGAGGFLPAITLSVGASIASVSLADVSQDGRSDLLLADQATGEVEVVMNLGGGSFGPPALYRAGAGLSAVVGGDGTAPLAIESDDGTIGVAAADLTPGEPPDIVALNAGANTIGILAGLGNGQFANPYTVSTADTTLVIRVADLDGNGIDDLAILGPGGLTIWMGNGLGGFLPEKTYNVGPDPRGLSIAAVNGDQRPDLVVGNAFGDVLVLLNLGNGMFKTPTIVDQSVALAVTYTADGTPSFIYSDQSRDRITEQTGGNAPVVVADRTSGLIVPGVPVLAALNGDNIPDLIVANEGSDYVSILLNVPQGNSFTFVPGPRLDVGQGPVSLLYGKFFGNSTSDLVVSFSNSDSLEMLPSLGDGFFNESAATLIPLSTIPGPLYEGSFGAGRGLDIVALDPDSNQLTLIFGQSGAQELHSSGGVDPVAAAVGEGLDGFQDLVVANYADGRISLLAGSPQGLTLEQVSGSPELVSPTGLSLGASQNSSLEVYAANAGLEAAFPLGFSLESPTEVLSLAGSQALTLAPLNDMSIPLIASLLTPLVDLNATAQEPDGSPEAMALVVALSTTTTTMSLGQGAITVSIDGEDEVVADEFVVEQDGETADGAAPSGLSPRERIEVGLDEAFEEFRRATQPKAPSGDAHDHGEENKRPEQAPPARSAGAGPVVHHGPFAVVDAAIELLNEPFLGAAQPRISRADIFRQSPTRELDRPLCSALAFVVLHTSRIVAPARPADRGLLSGRISARRCRGIRPSR